MLQKFIRMVLVVLMGLLAANRALAEAVELKAQPFDLDEVRLLDSPFKAAQKADAHTVGIRREGGSHGRRGR